MRIKLTTNLPIDKKHKAIEGKEYDVIRIKGNLAFVKDENGDEFGVYFDCRGRECEVLDRTGWDDLQ